MTTETNQAPVISENESRIAKAFVSSRQVVEEMEVANLELKFDYDDKTGNKNARSHVASLRKVKADVERCRKSEKQGAIAYGQLVDKTAQQLTMKVIGMIDVHAKPLEAIKEKEDKRQDVLKSLQVDPTASIWLVGSLGEYKARISLIDTGECGVCAKAKAETLVKIEEFTVASQKRQDDAERLLQLEEQETARVAKEAEDKRIAAEKAQKEVDEKARMERERIAVEQAAAQAKKEAEDKAESERLAREEAQRQQQAESARLVAEAEQAKIQAEADAIAKVAAAEAETARLQKEQEDAALRAKAETARRKSDAEAVERATAARIKAAADNKEANIEKAATELAAFFNWKIDSARNMARAIADGKIPSLRLVNS